MSVLINFNILWIIPFNTRSFGSSKAAGFPRLYRRRVIKKDLEYQPPETGGFGDYSRSFLFGFLDGSLERKPKVKSEIKKITTL